MDSRCLRQSGGGLILYQAYDNLYAMTDRKSYLPEDKQISSEGIFDEAFKKQLDGIHVTWVRFGEETKQNILFSFVTTFLMPSPKVPRKCVTTNCDEQNKAVEKTLIWIRRGDGVMGMPEAVIGGLDKPEIFRALAMRLLTVAAMAGVSFIVDQFLMFVDKVTFFGLRVSTFAPSVHPRFVLQFSTSDNGRVVDSSKPFTP
nr:hypothetical protein [Tanacetum cinerariifolium]